MSDLEATFDFHWRALGGNPLTPEHRFAAHLAGGPGRGLRSRLQSAGLRDWRFDRADLGSQIAIEIDGGTWNEGGHVTGTGYRNGCEKCNAAQLAGWLVFRFTADMLRDNPAGNLEPVIALIEARRNTR